MKNFKYFLALLLVFTMFEQCYPLSVVYIKVRSGTGNLLWDDQKDACSDPGTNCRKRKYGSDGSQPSNVIITPMSMGGFTLTGTMTDSTYYEVDDPVAGTFTYAVPAGNLTFGPTDYLRIHLCTDYPALNNVEIDLDGVQTNSAGVFTVYIP